MILLFLLLLILDSLLIFEFMLDKGSESLFYENYEYFNDDPRLYPYVPYSCFCMLVSLGFFMLLIIY